MVVKKENEDTSNNFEYSESKKTTKVPIYLYIIKKVYLYTHKSQLLIMIKTGEVA